MPEWTFEARIENIPVLTGLVNAELEAADCPMKAQRQIDIAIDELFSNIANYAYAPGSGELSVRFAAEDAPRAVTLTFVDSGRPFDPLSAAEPDTSLPAEARAIGGLGIMMVRRIMDDVRYARRDGRNELSIRKNY